MVQRVAHGIQCYLVQTRHVGEREGRGRRIKTLGDGLRSLCLHREVIRSTAGIARRGHVGRSVGGFDAMALPHQCLDGVGHARGVTRSLRGHRDAIQVFDIQTVLHCAPGHEQLLTLFLAAAGGYADNGVGRATHRQSAAQRAGALRKKRFRQTSSDHHHFGGRLHFRLGKHTSGLEVPGIHVSVGHIHAMHHGELARFADRHESARIYLWRQVQDADHVVADSLRVCRHQSGRRTETRSDANALAAAGVVPGFDKHQIRAGALHVVLHGGARTAAQANHGENRCHADDDAQHGKQGAQAVAVQRAHRQPKVDGQQGDHGVPPAKKRVRKVMASLGAQCYDGIEDGPAARRAVAERHAGDGRHQQRQNQHGGRDSGRPVQGVAQRG